MTVSLSVTVVRLTSLLCSRGAMSAAAGAWQRDALLMERPLSRGTSRPASRGSARPNAPPAAAGLSRSLSMTSLPPPPPLPAAEAVSRPATQSAAARPSTAANASRPTTAAASTTATRASDAAAARPSTTAASATRQTAPRPRQRIEFRTPQTIARCERTGPVELSDAFLESTRPKDRDLEFTAAASRDLRPDTAPAQLPRAPRFDVNGHERRARPSETVSTDVIPREWLQPSDTRSALRERRKMAARPDPSFDIDGDGYVGQLDLFIANRFDEDGDGRLNERERANAIEAVRNGYLDQFVLGMERSIIKPVRVMHVGDQVIDDDDATPLMPPSSVTSTPRTRTQVRAERRLIETIRGEETARALDEINPLFVERPQHPERPPSRTRSDVMRERNEEFRARAGLTVTPDNLVHTETLRSRAVGQAYVEAPAVRSRSELMSARHRQFQDDLATTLSSLSASYKSAVQRAEEREARNYEARAANRSSLSRTSLLKSRRHQRIEEGHKFQAHAPPPNEWTLTGTNFWEASSTFVAEPEVRSASAMRRSVRGLRTQYDDMHVPDLDRPFDLANEPDPFKSTRVSPKRVSRIDDSLLVTQLAKVPASEATMRAIADRHANAPVAQKRPPRFTETLTKEPREFDPDATGHAPDLVATFSSTVSRRGRAQAAAYSRSQPQLAAHGSLATLSLGAATPDLPLPLRRANSGAHGTLLRGASSRSIPSARSRSLDAAPAAFGIGSSSGSRPGTTQSASVRTGGFQRIHLSGSTSSLGAR